MKRIRQLVKLISPKELIEIYKIKNRDNRFRDKSVEETFNMIKNENFWSSKESISGPGSELKHTKTLVVELDQLFKSYKVESLMDIPCGDFNWMQNVNLKSINYLGADIVEEIIEQNRVKYASDSIKFKVLDIITSDLGKHDVIITRDCLVHFSYPNIVKTIKNIKRSKSKYLLMTTFPNIVKNKDIFTGEWRPLNFNIYPFFFANPIALVNESYLGEAKYKSKSMGLWEINDLKIPFRLKVYCLLYKLFKIS